jgi:GTPase SAR1 family protein
MRDMYIQKGDGFIMVYSVSSAQSIDRVEELFKQISRLNEDKNASSIQQSQQIILMMRGLLTRNVFSVLCCPCW